MENILHRIESRLDDLTKAFEHLKAENEILRKEILGVSSSSNSEGMGLMETRTFREVVEKTEFFVTKINDQESNSECSEDSPQEFQMVKIRSRTEVEERNFLKETFKKLRKEKKVKAGESLRGTSVRKISNSMPFSKNVGASITIQLSNFLDSDLIDPHYLVRRGSKHREPLKVDESFSEAFSFKGDPTGCSFLCSFAIISRGLRLVFRCWNKYDGAIYFGIGLTPVDVSTDNTLDSELFIPQFEISRTPDVWITNGWSVDPVELFVTQGNLLIGGHMSNGPRSIVHIGILEFNPMFMCPRSVIGGKQRIVDGKTFESIRFPHNSQINSKSAGKIDRFSCVVETVNCLSVPLNNRNGWCRNSEAKNVLPMQILPLHRERFFMSDEIILEAMFSYEIISTDLALVIALKVGCGGKSFAAAFMPFPVVTGKKQVEELLDENQWKTHDYKKYSKAFEKMTLIAIRNIRAGILMTEEDKSVLKIRIFAV